MPGRSYQVLARAHDNKYLEPDAWLEAAPQHEGSWWSYWVGMAAGPIRQARCRPFDGCCGQGPHSGLSGPRHLRAAEVTKEPSSQTTPEKINRTSIDLAGKKGLVVGIANNQSIAYGCAKAMRALGANRVITYLNERAEPFVRPLAEQLGSPITMPCDVEKPGELEAVFAAIRQQWGRLDFALHAVAYAPKDDLHGRVIDGSAAGFARAMDVSCHSFIRMAKLAEPLMSQGGTLLTTSYYGGQKVIEHYNIMGPVKAALEAVVRELATELGPHRASAFMRCRRGRF